MNPASNIRCPLPSTTRTGRGFFATQPTLDYTSFPNQQYRVDVLRATADPFSTAPGDVLATIFQTQPGDPISLAPTPISFDLSPFAGMTVRLRFAEVDNQLFFQASVDNVAIKSVRSFHQQGSMQERRLEGLRDDLQEPG